MKLFIDFFYISNPDTESKVILLWYKILQLLVRQVNYNVNLRDLGQQVDFLIPYISHAGEDRDTTGLLGVIGLGRKSPLTARYVHTPVDRSHEGPSSSLLEST